MPRYPFREPYKATPEIVEKMRELRRQGKSYKMCGELCGVSQKTAQRWLSEASWVKKENEHIERLIDTVLRARGRNARV